MSVIYGRFDMVSANTRDMSVAVPFDCKIIRIMRKKKKFARGLPMRVRINEVFSCSAKRPIWVKVSTIGVFVPALVEFTVRPYG